MIREPAWDEEGNCQSYDDVRDDVESARIRAEVEAEETVELPEGETMATVVHERLR